MPMVKDVPHRSYHKETTSRLVCDGNLQVVKYILQIFERKDTPQVDEGAHDPASLGELDGMEPHPYGPKQHFPLAPPMSVCLQ